MDERADRIETLFDRALDLGPGARTAFLDAQCADDPDVAVAVRRLLQADAAAGGAFLEGGDTNDLPGQGDATGER